MKIIPIRPLRSSQINHGQIPSLTDQSFADECNINNIVEIYNQTGITPHQKYLPPEPENYIDCSQVPSLHEALTQMNHRRDNSLKSTQQISKDLIQQRDYFFEIENQLRRSLT